MAKLGKIALLIVGALFALVFFGAIIDPPPTDTRHPADRIAEGCKREFGHSQTEVTRAEYECTVRLLNRWAADQEQRKLDRVYRSSY